MFHNDSHPRTFAPSTTMAVRSCALMMALLSFSTDVHAASKAAAFALIVGVNRSADPYQATLRYADDDAARSFDLLTAHGAQTILLTRLDENTARLHPQAAAEARVPDKRAFDDAVKSLAGQIKKAKSRGIEVDLYVIYAGHGDVKDGKGTISLEDAHLDGAHIKRALLDDVGPDRLHLVIDACASFYLAFGRGPGGERRTIANTVDVESLANDPRVGLFLSTSSAAESHEWEAFQSGVFSHEVRSGLFGAADVDLSGDITYEELYAFVTAANAAIPNERYRPRIFARPPKSNNRFFDVERGTLKSVTVPVKQAGRYLLESGEGIRLADFHTQNVAVKVRRPPGTVYLRRVDDEREWVLPSTDALLTDLVARPSTLASRGALHDSFAHLFETPVSKVVVDGVKFPPLPALAPMRANVIEGRAERKRRVAVLDMKAVRPRDHELAELATLAMVSALRDDDETDVVSTVDIETLLEVRATKQLLGCPSDDCTLDFARVLDVDEVVTGRVGTRGEQVLIFASRLNPVDSRVIGHSSHGFSKKGNLKREVASVGRSLFHQVELPGGHTDGHALRTAVIVDETVTAGTKGSPLGACLERALKDADIPLVDANTVARIKSRLSPKTATPEDVMALVDEDFVDVIVGIDVGYESLDSGVGLKSTVGTGSARVWRVDTGSVVESIPVKGFGNGHTSSLAVFDAGQRLCAKVSSDLKAVLEMKQRRAVRVVVEVSGLTDRRDIARMQKLFAAQPSVARTRVVRTTATTVILDVAVEGGDGVSLALTLPDELLVKESSGARIVVTASPERFH